MSHVRWQRGYADLIDEGDGSAEDIVLHLTVVENETTVLDYRTMLDENANRGALTVHGFLHGDGVRLDFDIEAVGTETEAHTTLDVAFDLRVDARDFSITGNVSGIEEGTGGLGNIIGNPLETTVFLTHMIFDGTLDRFPDLKVCAAHGGGFLPSYIGRSDVACTIRRAESCANQRPVREYFRDQILVDSMVFSEEGIRHLVAEMGVSQVVYGSDMPYNWPDTIDLIADSPDLSNRDKTAILGGNLMGLLGIEAG